MSIHDAAPGSPRRAVAHLTTARPRDEAPIFHKECHRLAAAGFHADLPVADTKALAQQDGVRIHAGALR